MKKSALYNVLHAGVASIEGTLSTNHIDSVLSAFGRKALSSPTRDVVDHIITDNAGNRTCAACQIALHLVVHGALEVLVKEITAAVVSGEVVGEAAVDSAVVAGEVGGDAVVDVAEGATGVGLAAEPATIIAEAVSEIGGDAAGLAAEGVVDLTTAAVVNEVLTKVGNKIESSRIMQRVVENLCQRIHACTPAQQTTTSSADRRSLFSSALIDKPTLTAEANTIVSAVVLGFVGKRFEANEPCSFDIEHPGPEAYENPDAPVGERKMKIVTDSEGKKHDLEQEFLAEYQDFLNVLSAMSQVLDVTDRKIGDHLRDGQSPEGRAGELITGRRDGASLEAHKRAEEIVSSKAKEIQEQIAKQEITSVDLYEGRGAYTGIVSDPDKNRLYVEPTRRVIDRDPTRWHPGSSFANWGLIDAVDKKTNEVINLRSDKNGMGPLPISGTLNNGRIGYIHGMCSAIQKCCEWGGNSMPFEIATGTQTTKMASCFPCTTYMYAGNFPPSSTHLGRGESWVPPSNAYEDGEQKAKPTYGTPGVSTVLEQWHREIFDCLSRGCQFLAAAAKAQRDGKQRSFADNHLPAIQALGIWINAHAKHKTWVDAHGGNLFLDALTVHESEWKRLKALMEPLVSTFTKMTSAAKG